jgi:hemoglobin/transferrin/lactoferrin receptor protein
MIDRGRWRTVWLSLALIGALAPPVAARPAADIEESVPQTESDTGTDDAGDSNAEAEGEDSEDALSERVIVTATRGDADPYELPYAVTVLTAEDLQVRKQSRSFPEAFREVPSVLVQKTAHGQGSPFIRGFTGFHTLLMVDGIRLNHAAFRSGPNQYWATFDPVMIDQLELVRGPSSTLYGSDAVGGTVNVVTQSPSTSGGDGFHLSPQVYYRYDSATSSNVAKLALSGGQDDKVQFLVGAAYKNFGNVEAGGATGVQPNTGYEETDADVKVVVHLDGSSSLTLSHQRVDQDDVPRTHKTIFSKSFHGTTVGSERRRNLDQRRELTYVQYRTDRLGGPVRNARFSLSYHRHEEQQDRLKAEGSGGDLQGFDLGSWGLWSQFETPTKIGRLTYGFEYYDDEVDSFKQKFDEDGNLTDVGIQGPIADDATYELAGLFLQDELPVGSDLGLIFGLRYTYAAVDAKRVDVGGVETQVEDSWDNVVGNFRLLYSFNETWNGYFGISQGFRAPNLGDLTKLDDTSAIEVPSPGLEPEHFTSFEIGAKTRKQRWQGAFAYWNTRIDDLIVQSPTGEVVDGTPVVRKDNIGDGWVHGVELESAYRFVAEWWTFGSFTWMDGEVDQLDESQDFDLVRAPLSRLMPTTLNVGVRYRPSRYWAEALITAVDDQDDLALRDITDTQRIPPGGTPGYTIYTLRGGVTLRRTIRLSAALENITDVNYRVHGSGQNEPGLNFVFSVNATF